MRVYRIGPDGAYVVEDDEGFRFLQSDPWQTGRGGWEFGRRLEAPPASLLPPVRPGKIVGVGRSYAEHASELGNEVPSEPLLFLKAPSSLIGPKAPILLPAPSNEVHFEGEIALVIGRKLSHADERDAENGIFGVTAANDVTARDLQRSDKTFTRGKSFDSFCPLGPAVDVEPDLAALEVRTRVNGEERQRGSVEQMIWSPLELVVYISKHMTLYPRDLILTGTPSGVGPLAAGDRVEVEVKGVGVLENPVEEDLRWDR